MARRIEQTPLERPDFTRALDMDFPEWLETNLVPLTDYYNATNDAGPCAFEQFALAQFDCQKCLDEEDDDYFASGEWQRDEEAEPSDAPGDDE
jgi:hypothetical protein